jgi:hypothetical protein
MIQTKNSSFYVVGILGATALVGGLAFMIKTYFISNENEEEKIDEHESSNKTSKKYIKYQKKLSKANKIHLELKCKKELSQEEMMAMISKEVEEELEQYEVENRNKRLSFINNDFEYKEKIKEVFEIRHKIYDKLQKDFLFMNSSRINNELNTNLSKVNIKKVEKILYSIYVPKFDLNENNCEQKLLSKEETKEALIYHVENSKSLFSNYHKIINDKIVQNNIEDSKLDIMILRTKVDDYLYMKFGINFTQLMFLIYLYGLNYDSDISKMLTSIGK